MKLWQKDITLNQRVEEYTVGRDREMDLYLAQSDVLGTLAHINMLCSVGLLTQNELTHLSQELKNIYADIIADKFAIEPGVEDVHSQVEFRLTQRLGDMGKKVHSARSRNDQVLVDLRLFTRDALMLIVNETQELFTTLIEKSNQYKDILMPGYTHLQVAMPSSFGLWFGAYAESLTDDLELILSAYKINNQNPLGSAAGYGSSFPINRSLTTELLGFDNLNHNVVYAHMGRVKVERIVAFAMANLASTIARMSDDLCLYMSQNFGFVTLPDELTTGSSIMPHKKNPDVFELTRARCNRLQALPVEIGFISGNMTSGYFRDYQMVKERFLPAFDELKGIIEMFRFFVDNVEVNTDILSEPIYTNLFTVEEVNKLVLQGVPFRDAYKAIGKMVSEGQFSWSGELNHTHEGSIGNLCNDSITKKMNGILAQFNFKKVEQAKAKLLA
jgi:argininosuccinate lyase